jgi:REP element-mobilizing transposase RayT
MFTILRDTLRKTVETIVTSDLEKAMTPLPMRKHVRMRDFEYRTPGAYFFTICLHHRNSLFGMVSNGSMHHNDIGKKIVSIWEMTSMQYPSMEPDSFILMPDHAHGIVWLNAGGENETDLSPVSFTQFMNWFKSMTTLEYGRGVRTWGWPPYDRHLWQPDYIERLLRDERELVRYRNYIEGNPGRWSEKHE